MASVFESKRNRIVLKPRFQLVHGEPMGRVLSKFKSAFSSNTTKINGKIVGTLIVIDVAQDQEHFWSPQLQLQLEDDKEQSTLIRGHYGPKPSLWTLFMFIHFGVAVAFAIFATMLFTNLSLEQDYGLSLFLTLAMPVLWILFYLFGRWGKKKGSQQMQALDDFMKEVLQQEL